MTGSRKDLNAGWLDANVLASRDTQGTLRARRRTGERERDPIAADLVNFVEIALPLLLGDRKAHKH